MSETNSLSNAIEEMVSCFLPHCTDQSTILELREMAWDPRQWREAHKLFRCIRDKTLQAGDAQNHSLLAQYSFEEICAKTLYNMADHSKGFSKEYLPRFDYDTPFWLLPIAARLARELGLKVVPCGSFTLRIDDGEPRSKDVTIGV